MKQVTKIFERADAKKAYVLHSFKYRRAYSVHAKLVNNAFLIVFEQYEKAFEELAKV